MLMMRSSGLSIKDKIADLRPPKTQNKGLKYRAQQHHFRNSIFIHLELRIWSDRGKSCGMENRFQNDLRNGI